MKRLIFIAIGLTTLSFWVTCNKPKGDPEEKPVNESAVKETTEKIGIQKPFRLTLKQANNLLIW